MIFDKPIFTEAILPFTFVFVVIFAILQKSKILGEGKHQIDAMTSLIIALILIGVSQAREIVVGLMPWLAVGVAVILVFFILYGFIAGDLSQNQIPKNLRITLGVLAALFTVAVILYVTGLGDFLGSWFSKEGSSEFWISILLLAVIIGVATIAIKGKDWGTKNRSSS